MALHDRLFTVLMTSFPSLYALQLLQKNIFFVLCRLNGYKNSNIFMCNIGNRTKFNIQRFQWRLANKCEWMLDLLTCCVFAPCISPCVIYTEFKVCKSSASGTWLLFFYLTENRNCGVTTLLCSYTVYFHLAIINKIKYFPSAHQGSVLCVFYSTYIF